MKIELELESTSLVTPRGLRVIADPTEEKKMGPESTSLVTPRGLRVFGDSQEDGELESGSGSLVTPRGFRVFADSGRPVVPRGHRVLSDSESPEEEDYYTCPVSRLPGSGKEEVVYYLMDTIPQPVEDLIALPVMGPELYETTSRSPLEGSGHQRKPAD